MCRADRIRTERGVTLLELVVTMAIFAIIFLGVVATWTKGQEAYFVGSEVAETQQNVRTALDFMVREIQAAGRDVTLCAFDFAGPGLPDCTTARRAACAAAIGGAQGTFYSSIGGCNNVFAIPIANATSTTIRILADRNDNGTIARTAATPPDGADEDVTYAYSTGSPPCPGGVPACVTRDDGTGPVAMIAVDVSTLIFTYFPIPGFAGCLTAPCASFVPGSQGAADNIGRIRITITAIQNVAGNQVRRTLVSDVELRNRGS
jgi:prepilin-type N-terminal cleavage/methylation domain-containing protein